MASEHTGQAEMRVPGLMKKDMDFREVKVCHFQTTHGICELMTMLIFLCPLKSPEVPHSLCAPPNLLNLSFLPVVSCSGLNLVP